MPTKNTTPCVDCGAKPGAITGCSTCVPCRYRESHDFRSVWFYERCHSGYCGAVRLRSGVVVRRMTATLALAERDRIAALRGVVRP